MELEEEEGVSGAMETKVETALLLEGHKPGAALLQLLQGPKEAWQESNLSSCSRAKGTKLIHSALLSEGIAASPGRHRRAQAAISTRGGQRCARGPCP